MSACRRWRAEAARPAAGLMVLGSACGRLPSVLAAWVVAPNSRRSPAARYVQTRGAQSALEARYARLPKPLRSRPSTNRPSAGRAASERQGAWAQGSCAGLNVSRHCSPGSCRAICEGLSSTAARGRARTQTVLRTVCAWRGPDTSRGWRARSALQRLAWRNLFERNERSECREFCASPELRAAQGSRPEGSTPEP